MNLKNLNDLIIPADEKNPGTPIPLKDYHTISKDLTTEVYFKDLEKHLIHHIDRADIVVGCVAWLTNPNILTALSNKKGVSIIVQKEDFLRPDTGRNENPDSWWKKWLRRRYDSLPGTLRRIDYFLQSTVLTEVSYGGFYDKLDAVRCVGNYNSDKLSAFPRSHHKFVVFAKEDGETPSAAEKNGVSKADGETPSAIEYGAYIPYAVWTGSFNFTQTSSRSFENALVLTDPNIVNAYLNEYAQIAALSEPLDWSSKWVAPEWRVEDYNCVGPMEPPEPDYQEKEWQDYQRWCQYWGYVGTWAEFEELYPEFQEMKD